MIRVIVADDHRLVVESLRRILDSEQDIECVGVADNGLEATQMAKELQPDVAILDVDMPNMDGIEATRKIKTDFPKIAVLVLTAYDYEEYVVACLEAGADGFVLKANLPCDGLVNAVRTVNMGRAVFDQDAISTLKKFALGKDKSNIFRKLNVQSRIEAVMVALRKGWVSISDSDNQAS
jgi:DNA-binding NarL/FixJ family response regulator